MPRWGAWPRGSYQPTHMMLDEFPADQLSRAGGWADGRMGGGGGDGLDSIRHSGINQCRIHPACSYAARLNKLNIAEMIIPIRLASFQSFQISSIGGVATSLQIRPIIQLSIEIIIIFLEIVVVVNITEMIIPDLVHKRRCHIVANPPDNSIIHF